LVTTPREARRTPALAIAATKAMVIVNVSFFNNARGSSASSGKGAKWSDADEETRFLHDEFIVTHDDSFAATV
jgi:hypothetical protein